MVAALFRIQIHDIIGSYMIVLSNMSPPGKLVSITCVVQISYCSIVVTVKSI